MNVSLYLAAIYKCLRLPVVVCFIVSLITIAGCLGLQSLGVLQGLELSAYDRLLLFRDTTKLDDRITVIGETEADIRRYGHPIPDQVFADALQIVENAGVRVIGVDKYRDRPAPPGAEALQKLLQHYQNIVWVFFAGNQQTDTITAPAALLEKPEQIGFSNIILDADDVSRRGLLFLEVDGNSFYSFPLLITLQYLAKENIGAENDEQGALKLNTVSLPRIDAHFGAYRHIDTNGYQIMLQYPGLPQSYRFFTLGDLLDGKIPAQALQDKIVLFGGFAPSLHDYRLLPNEIRRYGVEQHAYFISQLLNAALEHTLPFAAWADSGENAWLICWCLVGAYTGLRRLSLIWLLLIIVVEFLLLLVCDVILMRNGWWIPVIAPLVGWGSALALSVLYFSSRERAERRQLMQLFASHVSKEVANRLWKDREQFFNEGGVRPVTLTATVMFTDLSNFTSVAENMEPIVLMKWLNQYMEVMSACIIEHGGVINKYIGDAIMAVFGVPIKSETEAAIAYDAQRAVHCAMQFAERLRTLNQHWQQQGLPSITMRAGVYTGSLVAGSFGGSLRMEFTVIGDTVNIASRLESFDKNIAQPTPEHPCRVLIGETTQSYVSELYPTQIVGEFQLKGKNKFLKIFQVLGAERSF
ncbi:adenylate/guanylate cyclase domain-containing protein [Methylomonas sp. AM2-LC]|uniref:CHASE2 domain-containing protein n=1 Tax=Methylomonas sp. AM2-LC TaxID=3153301 RepID=UPI0032665FF3